MNKNKFNALILATFFALRGGVATSAEYSQTINSLAGKDISYKNDQDETVYVEDSNGSHLKYHASAYEVNEVGKDDAYDFKIYTGLDENNTPQFEYYTYSLNGDNLAPNSISNITKLAEAPEGGTCNATNNCFKVARGVGEDGYSTYDYYTYELRADGEEYQSSEMTRDPDIVIENKRFIGQSAMVEVSHTMGGAILVSGKDVDLVKADFIGNMASDYYNYGGAIEVRNNGTIDNVVGDFIANQAGNDFGFWANGGAIESWNQSFNTITGNFIGNRAAQAGACYGVGGAIKLRNSGNIKSIVGDFIGNWAGSVGWSQDGSSYGGALTIDETNVENITGDFINNYVHEARMGAYGGAIANWDTIKNLTGNFINNHIVSSENWAIGGAILSNKETTKIIGDFVGNYAEGDVALAGALYNYGLIETMSGSFIDNHAKGLTEAHGGAIYNEADSDLDTYLGIVADGNGTNGYKKSVVFKNNYIEDAEGNREYEAIYNAADAVLNFSSENGGVFTFYDYVNGDDTAKIYFNGDGDGSINLYNDIKGQAEIDFKTNYILNMISPEDIHKNTFKANVIAAKNIIISKSIQMAVDVDLENIMMDRFEADNFTIKDDASISVTRIAIVSDSANKIGETTYVPFVVLTEDEEGNKIGTASGLDKISTDVTEASSAHYAYSVIYNTETGEFEFIKTGVIPQPTPGPTPEEKSGGIESSSAAAMAQAGAEAVASQALNRDLTMTIGLNSGDVQTLSTWVQTFGSKDDVELKNMSGTIDTQFYGIIGGVDSKKFVYNNGLQAIYGFYGAYMNGRQKHDGNRTDVRGGYAGVSVAFRKDIMFSNTILNGGYIKNKAGSEFGKDKFDTKVVSVANKTGADIKYGNYTLIPALSLSYMGIDTDDYTTKSGVKVKNKFMNVFSVAPELKVLKDFGEGLDGYAKVAYKMFFYDNNKVKANDVLLPAMSVKPYVEYGVGLKKDWSKEEWNSHDVSSYAEITRHDGGREGWNVDLGLKFDL